MRRILFLSLTLSNFHGSFAQAKTILSFPGVDAIYKRDDRELISTKTDPKIREVARAVALIASSERMEIGATKTLIKAKTLQKMAGLCADEKFSKNLSMPGCTGFLISKNVMATAGHCFSDEGTCRINKIAFDVDASKENKKGYIVPSQNIYSCIKILARGASDDQDFAIIQLDRNVNNRTPLKLSIQDKISDDARVFMIGHPYGMPLIYSKPASINDNDNELLFKAALNSFEGNSGSPVINSKTFLVEGILVNGQEDLVQDPTNECYRNKYYEGAGGEGVFRSSKLPIF